MSKAGKFLRKFEEDFSQNHHHALEGENNQPDQMFDGKPQDCPICDNEKKTGSKDIMMQHEASIFDDIIDKDNKRFILDTQRKRVDDDYDEPEFGQVIVKAKNKKEAESKAAEYDNLKDLEILKSTPREEFGTETMGYEKERKEFEKIGPEGVTVEEPDSKKKDWYLFDLD